MSTYLNMSNPQTRKNDFSDCPEILKQYLYYLENIRALSARSVNGYAIDLRTFFRFMKWHRGMVDSDADFSKISITDIDDAFIKAVTKSDIYEFLHYVTNTRGNSPAARARKLSSEAEESGIPLTEKPVTLAVREVAAGELKAEDSDE